MPSQFRNVLIIAFHLDHSSRKLKGKKMIRVAFYSYRTIQSGLVTVKMRNITTAKSIFGKQISTLENSFILRTSYRNNLKYLHFHY